MVNEEKIKAQAIDPIHLKDDLAGAKAVLIDVRERQEWDQGHLKRAHLMPLSQLERMSIEQRKEWLKPYGSKTLYLHCRSGGRVIKALECLNELHSAIVPLSYGPAQLIAMGIDKI